jgi:serine/threonine-protein kinase ULK/ATG1
VYLIMEFCAGGDLTNYIKKRGRVDGLQYIPSPGAAPKYYPHPSTGGLDEVVVRSFLRQLGKYNCLPLGSSPSLIHPNSPCP